MPGDAPRAGEGAKLQRVDGGATELAGCGDDLQNSVVCWLLAARCSLQHRVDAEKQGVLLFHAEADQRHRRGAAQMTRQAKVASIAWRGTAWFEARPEPYQRKSAFTR